MKFGKKVQLFLLSLFLITGLVSLSACGKRQKAQSVSNPGIAWASERASGKQAGDNEKTEEDREEISENHPYWKQGDVVAYLQKYQKLPPNFIKKEEAHHTGWSVREAPKRIIGGDVFGNREGFLPEKKGRKYYEADLCEGYRENRGPRRLIYSNDGLIYVTWDHYDSFQKVAGNERK